MNPQIAPKNPNQIEILPNWLDGGALFWRVEF